ncbi:structural cement protein Gp24 [Methylobacillus sp.]|uniref:structural cement protein Gp24 n=1 Tax=Methylobacillus sp. TaxID=56818 RepID=UPI002FE2173F
MAFQKTLNRDLPRGVAGDFASTNPRQNMLAGEAALVAGEPITVGQFAFADTATGKVYAGKGTGYRVGFVHRNNQAIVPLGSASSMVIPAGREVALFTSGDFYVVAPATVAVGGTVYALDADGTVQAVATNATDTGFKFAEAGGAGDLVKITRFAI